jgi:DNA-binding CsgD family transcriptional regulator
MVGRRTLPVVVRALPAPQASAAGIAAICIGDPRSLPRESDLAELHHLSPAQARLARELLQGHGLTAAARRLQINPNTAKSQLQKLFAKTGASRQSDLVRLLMDPVAYL